MHYIPQIYKCAATKSHFSTAFFNCIQDRKRLNALKNHYRDSASPSLPLSYGYVLIMQETLKKRFLNKQEKALLRRLITSAGIDYLSLCYKQKGQLHARPVQLDMLSHLKTFRFPAIDYQDLNLINGPSYATGLAVNL